MEFVIQLERRVACTNIFPTIMGKFCHLQEPCLVMILIVDRNLDECFHYAILIFCLYISLEVESGRQLLFHVLKVA